MRVLQAGASVYTVAILLFAFAGASFLLRLVPLHDKDTQAFVFLLVAFSIIVPLLRFGPCFARVTQNGDLQGLIYPLSPQPEEPESEEARAERELMDALANAKRESRDMSSRAWRCASCGEDNPGEFDICWKCQKEKVSAGI